MKTDILIIQRFFYNFREGFFDYLHEINTSFWLINSTDSKGRVTVHQSAKEKPYIKPVTMFTLGQNHIIFPFLIFNILHLKPAWIVSEGGQNTINNLQILIVHILSNKKYIIWDLGKGYDEFPNTLRRKIYMYFYKLTLRHAAYIYTYNFSGKEYFRLLGMNADKILVLNNTVDTRKIKRMRELSSINTPAELVNEIKKDQIIFIFVGALLPTKNIESLKDLLELLGSNYKLLIIGDGKAEYKSKLMKLFDKSNCLFLGYKKIDELAPYYNLASFAILPGLGGLSINQAMAFGLPVVCKSADGAEKDLVKCDETGYIYKSLQDASDYIKSKSPQDWEKMGVQSEALIYSEHSLEAMTEKFISKLRS